MSKAPDKCPMCGEKQKWKLVDSTNKGFSVGKAAVGAVLLGLWVLQVEHQVRRSSDIIVVTVDSITNIN